jgi:hypothetical protein
MCHGWDGKYTMKMSLGVKRIYEIPDELSSVCRDGREGDAAPL